MKWIEPENGGSGNLINLSSYDEIQRSVSSRGEFRIEFIKNGSIEGFFEYPDISSRDADYERIRRIALGIENCEISLAQLDAKFKKQSENIDPYAVDWSKIPEVYNYVATDADGLCFAYDKLPSIYNDSGWNLRCGEYKPLKRIENNPDWKNSLRVRPGTEKANA